jgi:hypothetical protein
MLQWVEIKRTADDRQNIHWFEYRQEWRTQLIDHRNFDQQKGHENPRMMACQNETFGCNEAYLGYYTLNMS